MTPEDSSTDDSDYELQEAFADGRLKPGLNEVLDGKRRSVNNVVELKKKLDEIKLKLPWIERLDMINAPAAMAPELALQLQQQEDKQSNLRKNNKKLPQIDLSEDPVLNDFKRETLFHRQAQAAVLEAIPKLHKLGVKTKRPDDYFAEMAKSDDHMNKVRQSILAKQTAAQKSERVKQIRAQRKMGKEIQVQAKLHRQSEKKQMLDKVKKFRKGVDKDLSFLENGKGNKKTGPSKKSLANRKKRNDKFGYGGRKRGSKANTSESTHGFGKRGGAKKGGKPSMQRPGKNRRKTMKTKKKGGKK